MHTYLLRRGITAIITVLIVATVVFIILRLLPGDPAQLILGIEAPPARVQEIRQVLGLDRPISVQYLIWLKDLSLGNFGKSLRSDETVAELLRQRMHVTFWIAFLALLIALAAALPLGIAAALRPWSWLDFGSLFIAQLGLAMPSFWLGILLILVFAVKLQWLPLLGYVNFSDNPVEWLRHLLLPACALGFIRVAILTRMVRVSMLEELGKEYVTVARAKGLTERMVILHHTLRNALLPVITVAGMQFGYLLGGAIIIEQVFALPGLGRLLLTAIANRDFPVIQGTVVFIALVFTGLNLIIDLLYGLLNPKISVHAQEKSAMLSHNKALLSGLSILLLLLFCALCAPYLVTVPPNQMNYQQRMQLPSWPHPFGTDFFGRDILARTIYGSRIALLVGIFSVAFAIVPGLGLGLIAGYRQGWLDLAIMHVMDGLLAFPGLLLAITMITVLGPGHSPAAIGIAIVFIPGFARVVRGQVFIVRAEEYVQAAIALGASDGAIIRRHILPNIMGPLIVQTTASFANAILMEAGLSFLGLGTQPPLPSWGVMLQEARAFLDLQPWAAILPGGAIALAVLGFNLAGDGLRDVLDPRFRLRMMR